MRSFSVKAEARKSLRHSRVKNSLHAILLAFVLENFECVNNLTWAVFLSVGVGCVAADEDVVGLVPDLRNDENGRWKTDAAS